jgi:two-component system cell cycle sensor histidine kinase/response regulator CckA
METILVVDDATDVLDLARDILEAAGYTVLTASGGEEALRVAERHPGPIHALLTDVVMPRVTGPELAHRLKRARGETTVVFMSGYSSDAIGQYGLMNAGAPFVGKPFTPALLKQKLRTALDYRSPFKRPAVSALSARPVLA